MQQCRSSAPLNDNRGTCHVTTLPRDRHNVYNRLTSSLKYRPTHFLFLPFKSAFIHTTYTSHYSSTVDLYAEHS